MLRRALLLARTIPHLEPEQLLFQLLRRAQGTVRPGRTSVRRFDDRQSAILRDRLLAWGAPHGDAESLRRADEIVAGRFDFLGIARPVCTPDWRGETVSRLWTYNLHYFDYARDLARAFAVRKDARYATRFVELATSWIEATDVGGSPAWDPYPISLRVVNWAYATILCEPALDETTRLRLSSSIYRQVRALNRRIERHILANHLIKNLTALALGGLLFEGPEPRRWLTRGLSELWREVDRQINDDGGHVERSPMYHAIVMGDLCELFDLLRAIGV